MRTWLVVGRVRIRDLLQDPEGLGLDEVSSGVGRFRGPEAALAARSVGVRVPVLLRGAVQVQAAQEKGIRTMLTEHEPCVVEGLAGRTFRVSVGEPS